MKKNFLFHVSSCGLLALMITNDGVLRDVVRWILNVVFLGVSVLAYPIWSSPSLLSILNNLFNCAFF